MGEIERKSKKRKSKRDLRKAMLTAVKTAALLGVALVAPNMPAALYKLGIVRTSADAGVMTRARKHLITKGLIRTNENDNLRLTEKGDRAFAALRSREVFQRENRRWDGRWRVLIFDIPEYRKPIRNKIRRTLQSVGFMRLQDSVWVYPFDCEDFIVLLKADFKIGKDIIYMIVDELEGDGRIKRHFDLNN